MHWKPISELTPDVEWAWLKTQEDGKDYTYVGYIHHMYDVLFDGDPVTSRMISCGEHHFATKRRIRPTHFCPIDPPKNGLRNA